VYSWHSELRNTPDASAAVSADGAESLQRSSVRASNVTPGERESRITAHMEKAVDLGGKVDARRTLSKRVQPGAAPPEWLCHRHQGHLRLGEIFRYISVKFPV
jgi:hypothetical protein